VEQKADLMDKTGNLMDLNRHLVKKLFSTIKHLASTNLQIHQKCAHRPPTFKILRRGKKN